MMLVVNYDAKKFELIPYTDNSPTEHIIKNNVRFKVVDVIDVFYINHGIMRIGAKIINEPLVSNKYILEEWVKDIVVSTDMFVIESTNKILANPRYTREV